MMVSRDELRAAFESRHGKELQAKLDKCCVAICGLGGLGSNIAISLARVGVGRLILIDHDRVDITNIHRQQYFVDQIGMYKTKALSENLARINPYMDIETHTTKLCLENMRELLSQADIICEAFDKADQKAMLSNFVLEIFPEKYLISGSGMAGLDDSNLITTRKVTSHFFICGDGKSDVETQGSLVATRVMACAAHEAHKVVQIINNEIDS